MLKNPWKYLKHPEEKRIVEVLETSYYDAILPNLRRALLGHSLTKWEKTHEVRMIYDNQADKFYFWDAYEAAHNDVIRALKLEPLDVFTGVLDWNPKQKDERFEKIAALAMYAAKRHRNLDLFYKKHAAEIQNEIFDISKDYACDNVAKEYIRGTLKWRKKALKEGFVI